MGFRPALLFAWAAVLSEVVGGALLMAGFLTRIAAASLAFTTGVAAFLYHHGDISGAGLNAFLFFVITLGLCLAGPGGLSIDRLFAPRVGVRPVDVPHE